MAKLSKLHPIILWLVGLLLISSFSPLLRGLLSAAGISQAARQAGSQHFVEPAFSLNISAILFSVAERFSGWSVITAFALIGFAVSFYLLLKQLGGKVTASQASGIGGLFELFFINKWHGVAKAICVVTALAVFIAPAVFLPLDARTSRFDNMLSAPHYYKNLNRALLAKTMQDERLYTTTALKALESRGLEYIDFASNSYWGYDAAAGTTLRLDRRKTAFKRLIELYDDDVLRKPYGAWLIDNANALQVEVPKK